MSPAPHLLACKLHHTQRLPVICVVALPVKPSWLDHAIQHDVDVCDADEEPCSWLLIVWGFPLSSAEHGAHKSVPVKRRMLGMDADAESGPCVLSLPALLPPVFEPLLPMRLSGSTTCACTNHKRAGHRHSSVTHPTAGPRLAFYPNPSLRADTLPAEESSR